jgi:hypothetical protein
MKKALIVGFLLSTVSPLSAAGDDTLVKFKGGIAVDPRLPIRSIAGRVWKERAWLIIAAIVFAGCSTSAAIGPSVTSEQERCQQIGGTWRATGCERGSGGGGGY